MRLNELPSAILREIFTSSWQSIELFKCGDRALNFRLSNNAVTEVTLVDLIALSRSRWPRCLSEFSGLEKLSINRGFLGPLGAIVTLRSELKKLPSSLKSLEITCQGIAHVFFGAPSSNESIDNDSADSDDEALPPKRSKLTETISDQLHLEQWNLDATWPHMERLVIGYSRFSNYKAEPLQASLFGLLPRSLTAFTCGNAITGDINAYLSALPSGLLTLDLPERTIAEEDGLMVLPKSLSNLGHSLGYDAIEALIKSPNILPNLIEFPCDFQEYEELVTDIHDGELIWPHNVLHLTLYYSGVNIFTHLPSNLISLDYVGQGPLVALLPEHVAGLPRTLQKLELTHIQWSGINVDDWPPNLTHLSAQSATEFGAHCFSLLPRSLKIFKLHNLEELTPGEVEEIENIRSSQTTEDLEAIGLEALEREFERWQNERARLRIRSCTFTCSAYIYRVESGQLLGLPLSLTEFDIASDPAKYPQRFVLPPNMDLCDLDLDLWMLETPQTFAKITLDDPTSLEYFPPTDSIDLTINLSSNADAFLDKLPSKSALYRSHFLSLLATFDTPGLKRSCLEYVPRWLKVLGVAGLKHLYNSELQYLPSKLTKLKLDCPLAGPLEAWTHMLPKTLTSLHANTVIMGSDIIHLPPKLTYIWAKFYSVSLSQIRQLPSELTTLVLGRCDERTKAAPKDMLHELSWNVLLNLCRPFWRVREYSESYLKSEIEIASKYWPSDVSTASPALSDFYPTVPPDVPQFGPTEEDEDKGDEGEEEEVGDDNEDLLLEDNDDFDGDEGNDSDELDDEAFLQQLEDLAEERSFDNEDDKNEVQEIHRVIRLPEIHDIDPRTARLFQSTAQ